jgi:cytochrome c556
MLIRGFEIKLRRDRMKRLLATTLLLGVSAMFADDHEAFEASMKRAGKTMGPLKKALDTDAFTDAAPGAAALVEIYDVTEKFWKANGAADAIAMSATGKAAAASLVAAVKASDAKAAFGKLAGTCKGCHDAHREKLPDGKYKIK